jgi:hypothetical protein
MVFLGSPKAKLQTRGEGALYSNAMSASYVQPAARQRKNKRLRSIFEPTDINVQKKSRPAKLSLLCFLHSWLNVVQQWLAITLYKILLKEGLGHKIEFKYLDKK